MDDKSNPGRRARRLALVAALLTAAFAPTASVAATSVGSLWTWLAATPWEWVVLVVLAVALAVVAVKTVSAGARGPGPVNLTGDGLPTPPDLDAILHVPGPVENLPRRSGHAITRQQAGDLRQRMATPGAAVAIVGLPGTGKTDLALEYAYDAADGGDIDVVWWVRAATSATLAADLAALAPHLGLEHMSKTADLDRVVTAVLSALRQRQWLIFFDDAPDAAAIRDWLPMGRGRIIITSRGRAWGDIPMLRLGPFAREESVWYLCSRLGCDARAADQLAERLSDLPLALALAAVHIERFDRSADHFLRSLDDPANAVRWWDRSDVGFSSSLAAALLIQTRDLAARSPAAYELFLLCCHLDTDDIDLDSVLVAAGAIVSRVIRGLAKVLREGGQELVVDDLLGSGLVSTVDGGNRVRTPRLVSEIVRRDLASGRRGRRKSQQFAEQAVAIVDALFPAEPREPVHWSRCEALSPHANAALEILRTSCRGTPAAGRLLTRLGIYRKSRGQLAAAASALEVARTIHDTPSRRWSADMVDTLIALGNVYRRLNDLTRARGAHAKARNILLCTGRLTNPRLAHVLDKLGLTERELGRWDKAHSLHYSAVVLFQQAVGDGHRDTARARANLGSLLSRAGRPAEAVRYLREAEEVLERHYGLLHPEVARVLGNLGIAYEQCGELRLALHAQERAVMVLESTYGPDHPDVLRTLINLAALQRKVGSTGEVSACDRLRQHFDIMIGVLGPDHPDVHRTRLILAEDPPNYPWS